MSNKQKFHTVRLLLGDQLNIKHSWFKETNEQVLYVMMEVRTETDYVIHHIQKVIGFFAAMRNFSETLRENGHNVHYFKITDKENKQDFGENLKRIFVDYNASKFEYLEPDEYRLDEYFKEFCKGLNIETEMVTSEHFYTDRFELKAFFEGKKETIMENFYRHMRRKHDILMTAGQPLGGKWNYDKSNRKHWNGQPKIKGYKYFKNNVDGVKEDIKNADIKTIGSISTKTFPYPINRIQALEQLKYFCEHLLENFGDFQDALHTDEPYLFHSRLSFALNLKIIGPKDVIKTVTNYYYKHSEEIDISQIEGFVRQILGWREYMRGMYWWKMPGLKRANYLRNKNNLPEFYWTANTRMNCLHHAIKNSLDNGYAHHIQRLMITGNYALLTETHPDHVDDWYLGIYVDAVEWVQLPNTRGMSQFADGGDIATKPYVSSANYIDKMSNYCKDCHYNYKEKTTEDACPFNSLYWNFLDAKQAYLKDNPRMSMMYALLEKMKQEDKTKIFQKASSFL